MYNKPKQDNLIILMICVASALFMINLAIEQIEIYFNF